VSAKLANSARTKALSAVSGRHRKTTAASRKVARDLVPQRRHDSRARTGTLTLTLTLTLTVTLTQPEGDPDWARALAAWRVPSIPSSDSKPIESVSDHFV